MLNFWALSKTGVYEHWHVWQLLTYAFLHADTFPMFPLHIAMNLLMLRYFGRALEVKTLPKHIWRLFLYGAIGAAVLWLALSPDKDGGYVVGASGAVFAFLTTFAVCFPNHVLKVWIIVVPVVCRARSLAIGICVFEIVCVIFNWFPFIAHAAHLGGAAVGWWYGRKIRHFIIQREADSLLPGWEIVDTPRR
jgi:membrane associated rhomboid family serine protease